MNYVDDAVTLYGGDVFAGLARIESESVQTCVTSPPYWGLRDYGVDGQIGLESTPDAYVQKMVAVFREVRRVLKDDGTLWLNLGDSYSVGSSNPSPKYASDNVGMVRRVDALAPKNLCGIPWRVAFALQADGWYLRSDIIWNKKSPMPESVTDRPTRSHEYIFLFSKSERYYYDAAAIAEPVVKGAAGSTFTQGKTGINGQGRVSTKTRIEKEFRNKRTVWTVGPQPFTDWGETSRLVRVAPDVVSDDTKRITSPSCPVHGDSSGSASIPSCDAHGAGQSIHNGHTSCHEPIQQADFAPIGQRHDGSTSLDNSDSEGLPCLASAKTHNNQTHRTDRALATSPAYTASVETSSRTAGRSILPSAVAQHLGIDASNTWPDAMDARLLDQIPSRIVGKSSSVPPGCECGYYNKVTEKTSHFATFPPKLIEPCILAGSRCGDTVLDPFAGSGTTLAVSKRLGRKAIGIELNPDYVDLAMIRVGTTARSLF